MENTYVVKLITPMYTNKRTEIIKNPKVFFIDTGMRNYSIQNFNSLEYRDDSGSLHENIVLNEFLKNGRDLKFWRTKSKAEVDFIYEKDRIVPIEIKSILKNTSISRSLQSFIHKYNPENAIIYNSSICKQMKFKNTVVHFLPHWIV